MYATYIVPLKTKSDPQRTLDYAWKCSACLFIVMLKPIPKQVFHQPSNNRYFDVTIRVGGADSIIKLKPREF